MTIDEKPASMAPTHLIRGENFLPDARGGYRYEDGSHYPVFREKSK